MHLEQQHAEFGQKSDAFLVLHQLKSRWAEHESGKDVANNGWLFQAREQDAAGQCDKDNDGQRKEFIIRKHCAGKLS